MKVGSITKFKTLKEAEEYLNNPLFRIRFQDETLQIKTVKSAIKLALERRNTCTTTKAGKFRQQYIGISRSLEDLFCLCKYYFPEVTLKEVIKELKAQGIYKNFCSSHRKHMFTNYKQYNSPPFTIYEKVVLEKFEDYEKS